MTTIKTAVTLLFCTFGVAFPSSATYGGGIISDAKFIAKLAVCAVTARKKGDIKNYDRFTGMYKGADVAFSSVYGNAFKVEVEAASHDSFQAAKKLGYDENYKQCLKVIYLAGYN